MFRKSLAFIPVLAVLLLGSSLRSNAQSTSWVSQIGTVQADPVNSMTVHISVNVFDTGDPLLPLQITGSVTLYGSSGTASLNVGAPVSAVTFGNTSWNNRSVKTAILVTNPFHYIDLNTGAHTLAVMKARVTQYGRGVITYQIVDADTGVTLAASMSSDGQLNTYPVVTGSTSIHF